MLLVQPYFCHKSLGHRIRLSYSTNFKHYKGYNFKCNDKYEKAPYNYEAGIYQLDRVEKLVQSELGGADLMVLLGYDSNDFSNNQFLGGTTGIASRGIVCRPQAWEQEKDKWSMNEYSNKGAGGIAAVSICNSKWLPYTHCTNPHTQRARNGCQRWTYLRVPYRFFNISFLTEKGVFSKPSEKQIVAPNFVS